MNAPVMLPRGELIVDLFAGGGGASLGIRRAVGREPDVAINHDPPAIIMHARNHRGTKHFCKNVWDVPPREATGGRPVGLLWASPDCTHHSRARGGKPRRKEKRDLAWVVLRWAREVHPRFIFLENVTEFETWGPLGEDDKPIKAQAGETFLSFVGQLRLLGYRVEWRSLVAADYGDPTTRQRLFLIAHRDNGEIFWPAPTHGPGRGLPWRTAAECIDWDIPCPSIFLSPDEARAAGVKRPLAEATQRRIAAGFKKFVIENPDPFLLTLTHGGRLEPLRRPLSTVTCAHRGEKALVTPYLLQTGHQSSDAGKVRSVESGVSTIVTKAEHCLAAPVLVQTGYGERPGQDPRCLNLEAPIGTLVNGQKHALASAFLVRYHGERREGEEARVESVEGPLPTQTTENRFAVATAFIAKNYTGVTGHGVERPIGSITSVDHHSLVTAFLSKFYGTSIGADVVNPAPTVTSGGGKGGGHLGLVSAHVIHHRSRSIGADVQLPAPTVTAGWGGRLGLVAAFLLKYYGEGSQWQSLKDPMHTVVSKARFGLVTVMIEGEEYAVVDIGMRMLQPEELKLAQGFDADYILTGNKSQQVERIGNSVCPGVAEAVVRAQPTLSPEVFHRARRRAQAAA